MRFLTERVTPETVRWAAAKVGLLTAITQKVQAAAKIDVVSETATSYPDLFEALPKTVHTLRQVEPFQTQTGMAGKDFVQPKEHVSQARTKEKRPA